MLILNEHEQSVLLQDIKSPVPSNFFWSLNLEHMDFTLTPLEILTETTGGAVKLECDGFSFWVPTNWSVLIYDPENSILDLCKAPDLALKDFEAVTHGANQKRITGTKISVIDVSPDVSIVAPLLNTPVMLCHPIAQDKWIVTTPNRVYNKFLKNMTIGELF